MRSTFSLLGTIKCSTCGIDVDIAELGDHVCAPQKEEEPILLQKKPAAASQDSSRQAKHALPPIDPGVANRAFIRREEPTPRSSSSGSQEISPATPADGQPLLQQPFGQSSAPQFSASSSVYTAGTPGDSNVSPQHLFAPPPNDALYAPASPTVSAGSSLMAKLTSIAPGPFALNASSPPPLASSYGERPSSSKGKTTENNQSPCYAGLSSMESDIASKNEKQREQTERKLSGTTELEIRRDRNSAGYQRPPTSGSDRSSPSRGSQSSVSDSPTSSEPRPDCLKLKPYSGENNSQSKAALVEIEKPLPSPSYQAYRPPQPPQRLPRSPTFPDRPRTPAGYGPRLQGTQRLPVGLPSSPAHNRQQSNVSTNGNPCLLPQLYPGPGPMNDRSGPTQRGLDRLTPNPRDRSASRPSTRDDDDGRPRRNEIDPVGNPYRNSPLSASRSLSSLSTSSTRTGSTIPRTRRPQIPPPSKPLPHIPGHQKPISTSGSLNLGDIDSLMKDLQDSIKDFNPSPVADEGGLRSPGIPPSPLHINRPTTPNEQSPKAGKLDSPNKKTAVKSNCRGCGGAIKGKGLTSSDGRLTGRYHKECFVCQTCREPFATSTFYVWDDLPYCSRHYHTLNNSLCKSCDLGIEGPCLETERSDRFHPHCFTCMVNSTSTKYLPLRLL
ncbi:hypothetical protein L211DRAFT_317263 [Terfezia boudieri ATCC MYA-4762]|uniref:LIM zinc-binding domain-containing protein n=1 Tax=Terfezia boudieri ATCC MYA-4762 TaxID=1051890 RepID=A0A3N4LPV0_9PEZI|nr:hypothetical protein L211DRAFT_317263 [Terfezia boudieri ATCC MYA-4762]